MAASAPWMGCLFGRVVIGEKMLILIMLLLPMSRKARTMLLQSLMLIERRMKMKTTTTRLTETTTMRRRGEMARVVRLLPWPLCGLESVGKAQHESRVSSSGSERDEGGIGGYVG